MMAWDLGKKGAKATGIDVEQGESRAGNKTEPATSFAKQKCIKNHILSGMASYAVGFFPCPGLAVRRMADRDLGGASRI